MGKIRFLIGGEDKFKLETRIFHAICLMFSIVGLLSMVLNIIIGLPLIFILLTVFVSVVPIVLFTISRLYGKTFLAKVMFVILSYAMAILFWFYTGGIDGIVVILFIPLLILQIIFTKRFHLQWLIVNLIILVALLLINYFYPSLIVGEYRSESDRFADHGFTSIVLGIMIYVIIENLVNNYKQERRQVDQKNIELENVNLELLRNIVELENVNSTKNKLFSVVSHDIRSFAANIQNFSYLLVEHKDDLTPENDQLYKKQIYNASKNLEDLLNNLLSWARLQMKAVSVNPVNCNVHSIVKINSSLYKLPFENKKINVEVNISKDHEVYADTEMTSCIVRNIISNALKFTDSNGLICISSKLNETTKMIDILFADSGVGMNQNKINQILNSNKFYSERGTNNEKGSGMGLILVKEFVDANKGKLHIDSTKGKGTQITVSLPFAK